MLQAIGSETTKDFEIPTAKNKQKNPLSLSPTKDKLLRRNILAPRQINEGPKVNR